MDRKMKRKVKVQIENGTYRFDLWMRKNTNETAEESMLRELDRFQRETELRARARKWLEKHPARSNSQGETPERNSPRGEQPESA